MPHFTLRAVFMKNPTSYVFLYLCMIEICLCSFLSIIHDQWKINLFITHKMFHFIEKYIKKL